MRSKKGQGLSMNTIVIAALVIIVLIVLIVVFGGRMNLFGDAYDKSDDSIRQSICLKDGYTCTSKDKCTGTVMSGDFIDCSSSQVCCESAERITVPG